MTRVNNCVQQKLEENWDLFLFELPNHSVSVALFTLLHFARSFLRRSFRKTSDPGNMRHCSSIPSLLAELLFEGRKRRLGDTMSSSCKSILFLQKYDC